MKRAWPFLLAIQLCGCVVIYYPYRSTIQRSGKIVDESGVPISDAIVGAIVYTYRPYDRPLAYSTVKTDSSGEFRINLKHTSEADVSLAGGGMANNLCVACKSGYEMTYFPCVDSGPITLKSLSLQRSRADQLKDQRYPRWHVDSYVEYLMSKCDLRLKASASGVQ